MEQHVVGIKAGIAGFFGLLTAVWGWLGWLVVGWVMCMLLDWISGSLVGTKHGKWSSARAREGIWHKGGMVLIVLCAAGADWLLGVLITSLPIAELPFEYTVLICPLVICWYIVTELGSILENAVNLGAPCPAFLRKMLAVMNSSITKAGDKIAGGGKEKKDT